MKQSFLKSFSSYKNILILTVFCLAFFLLRLPSLSEPDWYGDEGIYQVIGKALVAGRVLYSEIWDNKPPLLYVLYALVNGDLFWIRFLSMLFGVGSVIVFYFLAQKLFRRKISTYFSTTIYILLFATPLFEGNIANAENFMLLPIITAFYLFVSSKTAIKNTTLFAIGLLFSAAFLIKIVAVFDLAAFLLILISFKFFDSKSYIQVIVSLSKNIVQKRSLYILREELYICIAFLLPIIVTIFYFLFNNALSDFIRASLFQNVGYVGYGNYFLFPMGALVFKVLFLIAIVYVLFLYKKILGTNGFIIGIWLAFSIFNALFSQRPYGHYILVLLPAMSLLIGYIFENKKAMLVGSGAFVLAAIIIAKTFQINPNFLEKTPYYVNYLDFIFGRKSVVSYQAFFDGNTPLDYDIVNFIDLNTSSNDNVFLLTDSAQIYALSNKLPPGRYIVAYHMTFYKNAIAETKEALARKKPKYIITTKEDAVFAPLLEGYHLKYMLKRGKIYEQ